MGCIHSSPTTDDRSDHLILEAGRKAVKEANQILSSSQERLCEPNSAIEINKTRKESQVEYWIKMLKESEDLFVTNRSKSASLVVLRRLINVVDERTKVLNNAAKILNNFHLHF